LDSLSAHDTSMDMGHHVQQMAEEKVLLCTPDATHTKGSSELMPIRCGRVMMARLEGSLEAANSIAVPGSKATHRTEVYRTRIPFQSQWEMPVRNARKRQRRSILIGDRLQEGNEGFNVAS
jgi:hypothetical protein